uniref:WD_REPEATS_REGION domain-containing protein n=1 Tax=Trichobilharzia regenti TaxID=157069 RepID=A0AA85K8T4_TRIRE|nr:unnamed protein product [Trichobilharzia regenti]
MYSICRRSKMPNIDLLVYKYRSTYLWNRIQEVDVDHRVQFDFESKICLCDMALDTVESRLLLVATQDGFMRIFDVESPYMGCADSVLHKSVASLRNSPCQESMNSAIKHFPIMCVQWYPVDSGAFVSASLDKVFGIWDTVRLECVTSIRFPQSLTWLSMSPVSCYHNLIAISLGTCSGDHNSRAVLVDPRVGSTVSTLLGGHSQLGLTQVVWSTRASYTLVTGGRDGKILYWDIRFPLKPVYSLDKESGSQSDLAYSPEASAYSGPVYGLTFSPDGLHLISWGGSGSTLDSSCLRIWTSGPGDSEGPTKIPLPRPVNFGNVIQNSCNSHLANSQVRNIHSPQSNILPMRLAVTSGSTGDLWGAPPLCVFVPVRNRLLIASATKLDSSTRFITRHFSKIRSCVWNNRLMELYTCGVDGNLFTWPVSPLAKQE